MKVRLFCFPFAGGRASSFGSWPQLLPAEVEICAMQLPGRESGPNGASFVKLLLLVEKLEEVISPYLDGPFAFFGHSMGALVGFELVRLLRRKRKPPPIHLFIACHRAPQLPNPHPDIHRLPDLALVAELARRYETAEGLTQNAELREMFLPAVRSDLCLCETYFYSVEDPLDVPITVFGGAQDRMVGRDELASWKVQTRSRFTLRMLPGGHFFGQKTDPILVPLLTRELGSVISGFKDGHTL